MEKSGHLLHSPSLIRKMSLSVLGCPGFGESEGGNVIPFPTLLKVSFLIYVLCSGATIHQVESLALLGIFSCTNHCSN